VAALAARRGPGPVTRPSPRGRGMSGGYRRRWADAGTAVAGAVLAGACAWAVAPGTVGDLERRVFAFVNGWPDALRWPLWVFQTLGVLGLPLVVAAVALVLRRWRLALALVLLVPLKLGVERELLKELVQRERPGTTIPDAVLRDVPSAGVSFPSGHAVIVFGIVVLLAPYLRRRWLLLAVALAVLNSVARVYLGAHAPLDVVGGAAAGAAVAAVLNLVVGVPAGSPPASARGPGIPAGPSG
jgi:membrane-associated phospholipid phosphatase